MNYFFGFDVRLAEAVEYSFNLNHLFLLLGTVGIILAMYFGIHTKTKKGIKITKIVLASVLIVFELGRSIYNYLLYTGHYGMQFSDIFWSQMLPLASVCGTMCVFTIVVLFVSAFKKEQGTVMQFLFNILLGTALAGGVLTFITPQMVDGSIPILHWRNAQTLVVHMLIIFVPLYLIKIGELKMRLGNIWIPAVGFIMAGMVTMTVSQIGGTNNAFQLVVQELTDMGIHIPFPWHLPIMLAFMFLFPLSIYGGFAIFGRKEPREKPVIVNEKLYKLSLATIIGGVVFSTFLYLFIPSMFPTRPILSWVGLVCVIPLLTIIASLVSGIVLWRRSLKLQSMPM